VSASATRGSPDAVVSAPADTSVGALPRPRPGEEDEPEPLVEWDAPDPPTPPPLEGPWLAGPRPATAALVARYRAQAAELGRHGVREVHGKGTFDIVWEPAARPALRRTKEAAVAAVESRLAEAAQLAAGGALPARMTAFLARAFLEEAPQPDGEPRTPVTDAHAWLDGRVLGVVLSFPIVGGSDDVLVLFERERDGYRKSMVVAKHDYPSITEGQLSLDHVVRPVGAGYHVMTVHSSPWISSAWRGAHLKIFAPGPTATHPTLLLDERNSARVGGPGAALSVTGEGFDARFASWSLLGTPLDSAVRTHVHRFAWGDGRYRRASPFAHTLRELPDEWLSVPWSEAAAFTAEASRARLEPVHKRLSKLASGFDLRGTIFKKTVGNTVRLRLVPERDHAPIVFLLEGVGDQARITDVSSEEVRGEDGGEPM
jgi:hypothetical protein